MTDRNKRSTINEIVAQEEGIAMASEVLLTISRDEIERARILREEKTELDWNYYMNYAKEEGRQEILDLLKSGKSPEDIIKEFEDIH